jgi:hypothetical protein
MRARLGLVPEAATRLEPEAVGFRLMPVRFAVDDAPADLSPTDCEDE